MFRRMKNAVNLVLNQKQLQGVIRDDPYPGNGTDGFIKILSRSTTCSAPLTGRKLAKNEC